jgi:F0F1-type ATP synthase alpha subunit
MTPLRSSIARWRPAGGAEAQEVGTIAYLGHGIARVSGLPGVQLEEIVRFPGEEVGMAFNLDVDEVGVIVLSAGKTLKAGQRVRRTRRILDVPVGRACSAGWWTRWGVSWTRATRCALRPGAPWSGRRRRSWTGRR